LPVTRIVPPVYPSRPALSSRRETDISSGLEVGISWRVGDAKEKLDAAEIGMAVAAVSSEQVLEMNKIDYALLDYARSHSRVLVDASPLDTTSR